MKTDFVVCPSPVDSLPKEFNPSLAEGRLAGPEKNQDSKVLPREGNCYSASLTGPPLPPNILRAGTIVFPLRFLGDPCRTEGIPLAHPARVVADTALDKGRLTREKNTKSSPQRYHDLVVEQISG